MTVSEKREYVGKKLLFKKNLGRFKLSQMTKPIVKMIVFGYNLSTFYDRKVIMMMLMIMTTTTTISKTNVFYSEMKFKQTHNKHKMTIIYEIKLNSCKTWIYP